MPHVSDAPNPGTSPETLASIVCPDRLETPFGGLDFFDGMPMPDTVTCSYDTLDLLRGIEAFLNCVPGAFMVALRRGLRSIGVGSRTIGYTAPRCTSAPVVLTGNTETTYGMTFLALDEDGPTVIEAPGNSLCVVDDMWQRYVTDMGIAGPDKGEGGKYLFLPPGYEGEVPDGYFVVRPTTYGSWVLLRALGGTESLLTARIYPLSASADRPEQRFVNWAESNFNTVHANDFSFFEEIDTIVQAEPAESLDPERAGQLAALGIVRGRPFQPDDRMRSILDTAARIASGIVRTLAFKPRDPGFYHYPDRSWKTPFPTGSYEFLSAEGARLLDSRAVFYYFATASSPAMVTAPVGTGSQYAYTAEDSTGEWLDGGRHYTLTLPSGVPAKNFWAVNAYDPQTRSLLRTDHPYPSVNSQSEGVRAESNGDTVVHFGPTAPGAEQAELGADRTRQGVLRDAAALRPARKLVRQELAAGRDRTGVREAAVGEAIGQILSYGVAVALSAFPIIGVVLMLATPRARSNGPAMLLGWALGLALVGTVVLLVSGGAGPTDQGQPADWVSALDIALGVLLLWVAVKEWRGRPRSDQEVTLPKWMRTVDSFTPVKALALGTALSALNPKNLLLSIAAASAIARTGTSAGAQAVALAVYVVLGALGPGAPVVLYFALKGRSKHILDGLKLWMERNNTAIMAVICLLFAAKLVGDGISDLSS